MVTADPVEDAFSEDERLLLMAALVHGFGPDTQLGTANAHKVVAQALVWSEGKDEADLWPGYFYDNPRATAVHAVLVRMVRPSRRPAARPGPALFEGEGNWGDPGDPDPPSDPFYTSCRLTARGVEIAERLLAGRPELRKTLE
jgi:hypothetical protein